jgi:hypothetical protein
MIRNLRPKKGKREPRPARQAGRGWLNGGGPDPWDGGDRTSTRTMAANQLRLWFASMAYVLVEAIRRLALQATDLADATCGTIRRKLFKVGALVTIRFAGSNSPWHPAVPIRPFSPQRSALI